MNLSNFFRLPSLSLSIPFRQFRQDFLVGAEPLNAVQGARGRIVSAALQAIFVFGFVTFAASLLRVRSIGWQPVMVFHVVFWAIIAVTFLLRHRLPFLLPAWLLIGMFFALSSTGLVAFGLIGMSIPGFLFTTIFTTLLFGSRVGWAMAGVSLAMILVVGVGVSMGWIAYTFDASIYATAPASWIWAFLAFLMFIFICVAGISWTHEALLQSQAELIKAQAIARVGSWMRYLDDPQKISRSAECLRIIGYSADQAPKNRAEFSRHIHSDDRERIVKIFDAAASAPSGYKAEYRFVRPDGETRHLVELCELHHDDFGRVVSHAGTVQDVTEQKESEEQHRHAQRLEVVGQLTAGVAHDFNNTLSVIWGNAELLAVQIESDNPELDAMVSAIKRGADLTQRLLAFSRKQVLNPEIVNVNDLTANVTGLLKRTLEADIEIKVIPDACLWNCELDPGQLENVLVNLAINARDAMPDGGRLTIETANIRLDDFAAARADVRPGEYVMLTVADNGLGMPPEIRNQVFEPFFTTKEVGKGSGLGLSMVYGFVKQSGGNVTICSEPGEGTTIKLYLPRSTERHTVEQQPNEDEVPAGCGETVLVVDDESGVLKLTVTLLSSLGYQVTEASTGAQALEKLRSMARVDLLLSDVVLAGGMGGGELAVEAERYAPGIKVLFMSGYTETANMLHGRLSAGGAFLQKPFRKADLARAARKVLDGPAVAN